MPSSTRNLILLTIDAWRADFVDTYAGIPLMPHLTDRLASGGSARFDAVWSNGPWTTEGLIPMLTGQPPARHGVHWAWSRPRPGTRGLFACAAAAGFNVPNLCYLRCLPNYFNLGLNAATAPSHPREPNDPLLFEALAAAARTRRPFFAWYHYPDIHLPYWPAAEHRAALGLDEAALSLGLRNGVCRKSVLPRATCTLDADADADPVRRLYAAGVRQMDAWLGRVFTSLDRLGLTESTTVVLTADHGEELLERGHCGHASTAEDALLTEELLRIPLLVIDSRISGTRRFGRKVRVEGVDLFPTLLSLAGVVPPPSSGVDLAPLLLAPETFIPPPGFANRPFQFQSARMGYRTPKSLAAHKLYGLTDGRHKVVLERYGQDRAKLYDLEANPGESAPLDVTPLLSDRNAAFRSREPVSRLSRLSSDLRAVFRMDGVRQGLREESGLAFLKEVLESTDRVKDWVDRHS